MRLFDKYLLACTNQRIPMPSSWQQSLGLQLTKTQLSFFDDAVRDISLSGYRFQQDETLERGYVHRQVRSMQLDRESTYLLLLYLEAQREHKDLNLLPFLSIGETIYQFPYYVTTADILPQLSYSIYGSTTEPVSVRFYNKAASQLIEIANLQPGSLNANNPVVIKPQEYIDAYLATKPKFSVTVTPVIETTGTIYKFAIDGVAYIIRDDTLFIDSTLLTPRTKAGGTILGDDLAATDDSEDDNLSIFSVYSARTEEYPSGREIATLAIPAGKKFSLFNRDYTIEYIDGIPTVVTRPLTIKDLQNVEEYYEIECTASRPITIVPGAYPAMPINAILKYSDTLSIQVVQVDSKYERYPMLLPRVGSEQLPYSNKLIPTLLDINITDESPNQEKALIPTSLIGDNYKERILLNTTGIYDVDENLGDKIVW